MKKLKKEIIEWGIMIAVMGIIYLNGWHSELIGRLQQLILSTGVITLEETEKKEKIEYDLIIAPMEGSPFSFASFKGKILFVNFWASWCSPCIAEMPSIHALYKQMGDRVEFVMISLDENESRAREYIKRKGYTFPVYFMRSAIPPSYEIRSIPTTYLIDTQGWIKLEQHGMADYNSHSFKQLITNLSEGQPSVCYPTETSQAK